jgi:hypothetical protein
VLSSGRVVAAGAGAVGAVGETGEGAMVDVGGTTVALGGMEVAAGPQALTKAIRISRVVVLVKGLYMGFLLCYSMPPIYIHGE